ncbi:hypothetical protein, conserved [Babesia ovata]|uniref:Uncharacterized protein n=1 Tax=Babesia ovata TaxID=189622 RepID=A0A2H6K7Q9_9APIC|nr:uncharacterized protein BOVATA_004820 [Babesia ovata]GBE58989.1 hypothetical protein, conserved [Babesia ovata]
MVRTPKKLTDCPENLRESIDWLIQVKHGNGNGQGLDELAKALKRLINDAIEKATKSLNERRKELQCPPKYWQSGSYCYDQNELIEKKQKEIEAAKKPDNLDKNALDKLESTFLKLKSEKEKHYNEVHYLTEDARQSALDDIKERQSNLEDLTKKLRALIGEKDSPNAEQCKKLLENLIDGLENFLGNNKDSKGYTGEGIVYSDLDRLCDGVMAFLGGVLESVKGEDAVKIYDGYIQSEEATLQKVTDFVFSQIGKGVTGLTASVDRVKGWLEGYNDKVEEKTVDVTGPLNSLKDSIDRKVNAHGNNIDKSLREQSLMWRRATKELHHYITKSNDASKKLDKYLKNEMGTSLRKIDSAIEIMKKSAENSDLQELNKTAKDELEKLRRNVENKVTESVIGLRNTLQEKFEKQIQNPISRVKRDLEGLNGDLEKWIQRAEDVVNAAIKQCKKIVEVVHETPSSSEREAVDGAAGKLRDKAEELRGVANKVKMQIGSWVGTALKEVVTTNNALRYELNSVKEQINADINKYVNTQLKIRDGLYMLDEKVKNGLHTLQEQIVTDLNRYFEEELGKALQAGIAAAKGWSGSGDKAEGLKALGAALNVHLKEFGTKLNDIYTNANSNNESSKSLASGIESLLTRLSNEYATYKRYGEPTPKLVDIKSALTAGLGKDIKGVVNKHIADDKKRIDLTKNGMDGFNTANATLKGALENGITTQVSSVLIQKIGETDLKGKVNITEGNFSRYYACIKQDGFTDSTILQGNAAEGTLPKAINVIKENVLNDQHLGKVVEQNAPEPSPGKDDKFYTDTFKNLCTRVTEALGDLCKAVQNLVEKEDGDTGSEKVDDQRGVKNLLADLQEMLKNSSGKIYQLPKRLKTIHNEIKNTIIGSPGSTVGGAYPPITLTGIIKTTDEFYQKIDMEAGNLLRDIKDHVEEQVQEKINSITKKAQELYASRNKAELDTLKKIVETQKAAIERLIRLDRENGLKGFLVTFYGGDHPGSDGSNLRSKLKDAVSTSHAVTKNNAQKFKDLAMNFKKYLDQILFYIGDQVGTPTKLSDQATQVDDIRKQLDSLFVHLSHEPSTTNTKRIYTFDHRFSTLLSTLNSSIASLSPKQFANTQHPELLDALRSGMDKFTKEISRAYVNRYSGLPLGKLVETKSDGDAVEVLSTEGRNCAKVCLTILEGLRKDLFDLQNECKNGTLQINMHQKKSLGSFFHKRGYTVNFENGKQTGELQDKKEMEGSKIKTTLLEMKIENADNVESLKQWKAEKKQGGDISLIDIVDFLRDFSRRCYRVGHYYIPASPKSPSNIYNMLCWLAGLKYNHMYDGVKGQFTKMLDGLKEEYKLDTAEFPVAVPDARKHPTDGTLTYGNLSLSLDQVCLYSRTVLITFLGHGHADGVYAYDFSNNSLNLLYPTSASSCFDMLVDILNRVLYQLRFLCSQCNNGPSRGGWNDCWYGQDVGGSSWNCNDKQCANQNCPQIANQTSDQRCDQHPKCGLKSPLQSFLEDGLQGFLPHSFKTPGCKLTCTVSNHSGLPCLTPMGFGDISIVASRTQKGDDLKGVLSYFSGPDSHLNKLCSYLKCLLRVAPQTLGDMLAFYYCFLKHSTKSEHKKKAFDDAVRKAIFGQEYSNLNPTILFKTVEHGEILQIVIIRRIQAYHVAGTCILSL